MKTEYGLYDVLTDHLKKSKKPLTCVEMYEGFADVRKYANSANRVSDYLGGLWRKGLVERLPTPKESSTAARWMYQWKGNRPTPRAKTPAPLGPSRLPMKARVLHSEDNIRVWQDEGTIHIDVPGKHITIEST